MVELLLESVIERKNQKNREGKLARLERLTDHVLVEGLCCFRQVPDVAAMQRALQSTLALHAGFTALSVNKNNQFLLHRDVGSVLFSTYRLGEKCPDFFDLDAWFAANELRIEACARGRRDGVQPLTSFRLGVFEDGYWVLWFSSVQCRSGMSCCARFLREWSRKYSEASGRADSASDDFDTLFGAVLEYETKRTIGLNSAKGKKAVQGLIAGCGRQEPGERRTDDFVKNIKQKYCTEKYAKSGLKLDQSKLLWIKLRQLFEKEAPYLDVNFDLKKLAECMGVSQQILSQVINSNAGEHFYDLVDRYRTATARALLSDPENRDRKLLDIAVSSGFACQSTFFSHFKRATGLTPDAYRRMCLMQSNRQAVADSPADLI